MVLRVEGVSNETVKYGLSSAGLRSQSDCPGKALKQLLEYIIARVFRRDSPPTWSRRSEGSGRESSTMLISVEGNAVQVLSMLLWLNLGRLLPLKANE
jgi:hypothetical protein